MHRRTNTTGMEIRTLFNVVFSAIAIVSATEIDSLQQQSTLDEVTVSSQKITHSDSTTRKVSLGILGTNNSHEMPFQVSTVERKLIEITQAANTQDALRYSTLVQTQTGGSRTTDYFSIRGFSSSAWSYNIAVDGMRAYNPYEALYDKDAIDVFAGVTTSQYGLTSPGGVINYVSKQPYDSLLLSFTAGDQGNRQTYIQSDVNIPLHEKVALRLNGEYVADGRTTVEHQTNEQLSGRAAVKFTLHPNVSLQMDIAGFHRDAQHTQALFMIGKATVVPEAPANSKNHGGTFGYTKDNYVRGGATITWKILPSLDLRTQFRYTDFDREFIITRRNLANNNGGYTVRIDYQGKNKNTLPQGTILLTSHFLTGIISHDVSAGYSIDYFKTETPYPKGSLVYTDSKVYAAGSSYPANPNVTINSGSPLRITEKALTHVVTLIDKITIHRLLSVQAGISYSSIDDTTWAMATGALSQGYDKGAVTPTVALITNPLPALSGYVSFNQGLQKGQAAPTTSANPGEILEPFKSQQWEGGLKYRFYKLDAAATLFHINQANAFTDATTNVFSSDGEEIHNGIEFTVSGNPHKNIFLYGGATLVNAEIEKTSTANLKGKVPQGVAQKNGRFIVMYSIPVVKGLSVSAGLVYTGKQWVNTINTIAIPSYTLLDAGLQYEISVKRNSFKASLNCNNIGRKDYWTTRSGILYPGNPRTVLLQLKYCFR